MQRVAGPEASADADPKSGSPVRPRLAVNTADSGSLSHLTLGRPRSPGRASASAQTKREKSILRNNTFPRALSGAGATDGADAAADAAASLSQTSLPRKTVSWAPAHALANASAAPAYAVDPDDPEEPEPQQQPLVVPRVRSGDDPDEEEAEDRGHFDLTHSPRTQPASFSLFAAQTTTTQPSEEELLQQLGAPLSLSPSGVLLSGQHTQSQT